MSDAEIEDRVAAALYDEWAGDVRRYERLGKHGKATWRGIARAGMVVYQRALLDRILGFTRVDEQA